MIQTQVKLVDQIQITDKEAEIFEVFLKFKQHANLKTTFRVAGGWVRDKLMGHESHDIDIALDDMMGEPFVKLMSEFLSQTNEKIGGFGVTKYNPDQSKHLQTACVRIKDSWIDVVNLRGEEYASESRIPIITIGTPIQDAFRRDLTINSLFYNINTREIEDFTNKGIEDLKAGIIRTPLPPFQTFIDDPLRILRTFRFATRFGFKIEQDILEAINAEVKLALKTKISRERIRTELHWILSSDLCSIGLNHYNQNGLWPVIFQLPDKCSVDLEDQGKYHLQSYQMFLVAYQYKQTFQKNSKIFQQKIETQNFYFNLCSLCVPYSQIIYKLGKKQQNAVQFIVDDLKFTNKEQQNVISICEWIPAISQIKRNEFKSQIKLIVQFLKATGNFWELVIFLEYCNNIIIDNNDNFTLSQQLIDNIYAYKLEQYHEVKPILDGKEIQELFNIKQGPEIGIINQNILLWQALNMNEQKMKLIEEINIDKKMFLTKQ